MTNYNERLNEILTQFKRRIMTDTAVDNELGYSEAKQSLTSLIKELVAEAKPEKHIHHHTYSKPFEDAQDIAYNAAIDKFEQNLLKALEDIKWKH